MSFGDETGPASLVQFENGCELDTADLEHLDPHRSPEGPLDDNVAEIGPGCHRGAPVYVGYRYRKRTLVIICAVCRSEVAHVRVQERPS